MARVLKSNNNLFAWTYIDMSGIHPGMMSHRLTLFKEAQLDAQNKRCKGEERRMVVEAKVKKLKEVNFIQEVRCITWLVYVVMVKIIEQLVEDVN